MLHALTALAIAVALGTTSPTPTPAPSTLPSPTPTPAPTATPQPAPTTSARPTVAPVPSPALTPLAPELPPTQPGLGQDEGVFLVTTGDDGSRAVYFIAGNTRHSILPTDMQLELQQNPLWPVFPANRDDVIAFAEGAPVGGARVGLLGPNAAGEADAPPPVADAPLPLAEAPLPVADAPRVEDVQPAAAQPAALMVAPATEPVVYILQPGDNLTRLSDRFGTTIDAILAANGLTNPNHIYFGQPLLIPTGTDSPAPDVVETPGQPAPAADDAPAVVADTPPLAEVDAESPIAATGTAYTVRPGDSIFRIARKFGIDQDALLEANAMSDPNRVYAGQVLTIPGV